MKCWEIMFEGGRGFESLESGDSGVKQVLRICLVEATR